MTFELALRSCPLCGSDSYRVVVEEDLISRGWTASPSPPAKCRDSCTTAWWSAPAATSPMPIQRPRPPRLQRTYSGAKYDSGRGGSLRRPDLRPSRAGRVSTGQRAPWTSGQATALSWRPL
jgi:hypothetical protein